MSERMPTTSQEGPFPHGSEKSPGDIAAQIRRIQDVLQDRAEGVTDEADPATNDNYSITSERGYPGTEPMDRISVTRQGEDGTEITSSLESAKDNYSLGRRHVKKDSGEHHGAAAGVTELGATPETSAYGMVYDIKKSADGTELKDTQGRFGRPETISVAARVAWDIKQAIDEREKVKTQQTNEKLDDILNTK